MKHKSKRAVTPGKMAGGNHQEPIFSSCPAEPDVTVSELWSLSKGWQLAGKCLDSKSGLIPNFSSSHGGNPSPVAGSHVCLFLEQRVPTLQEPE